MNVSELILIILVLYLIFKDSIRQDISLWRKKPEIDEAEQQRQKDYKREFDNMVNYSVEDAIKSKRGDIDEE
jgi:hypothetical protein